MMRRPSHTQQVFNRRDAGRYLQISLATLDRLAEQGLIRRCRCGTSRRIVRYRLGALQAFLARSETSDGLFVDGLGI